MRRESSVLKGRAAAAPERCEKWARRLRGLGGRLQVDQPPFQCRAAARHAISPPLSPNGRPGIGRDGAREQATVRTRQGCARARLGAGGGQEMALGARQTFAQEEQTAGASCRGVRRVPAYCPEVRCARVSRALCRGALGTTCASKVSESRNSRWVYVSAQELKGVVARWPAAMT